MRLTLAARQDSVDSLRQQSRLSYKRVYCDMAPFRQSHQSRSNDNPNSVYGINPSL